MPQTGLSQLVADPELAAIQRRREMIAQLLRGNQVQDFRSPMSPLAPIANALAMALSNHYGQREETQLFDRRREEDARFGASIPSLGGLMGGGAPSAPQMPSAPPPGAGLPTGSATAGGGALPQTPGGRPMFSRMPDSVPAPDGQGFDPRQRNQDFAAMRARAMDTLQGDALAQELARISAAQAQQGSGLVPGASYRRPGPGSEGGAWDAPLASGPSGAVPAFGSGGPQAIPIQAPAGGVPRSAGLGGAPAPATGVQQPPSPAAGGITQDRAQAAAIALMQAADQAAQSSNPQIRARAAGLRQQAQMAMAMARQEAPDRELVRIRLPDGSERFVPRAQALGMTSAPEPDRTLVEIRQPDGSVRHVPRAQAAGMTSAPQPQQQSERERAQQRYIQLSLASRTRQLTGEEQAQLALDAQTLEGNPQIVAGPTGVGYVPPRTLPLGNGQSRAPVVPGAGAIPIQQGAPAGAPTGAIPVQEDAMPGAAAPTQRAPQRVQIPGRGEAQFLPAEQPPALQPTATAQELLGHVANVRRAREALQLATSRPESFGFWQGVANSAPGVLERVDPGGVSARAAAANLGSLVIHERSGAAVTAAEFPRLRPFIPAVGDPPAVVREKIQRFVQEYEAVLREEYQAFGPSGGYRALEPVEEILRGNRSPGPGGRGTAEPPAQVIEFDRNGRRVRR